WYNQPACGDVIDRHSYKKAPTVSPDDTRIGVGGEFGGFGYSVDNHLWIPDQKTSSVYGTAVDKRHYEHLLVKVWKEVFEISNRLGMSAAVYTQLTDVEAEINGLLTYDRKVIKMTPELIRNAVLKQEFPELPKYESLVPTSEKEPQEYLYTLKTPASNWYMSDADRSLWLKAEGVIGFKKHRNSTIHIKTEWKTPEIWVARSFDLPKFPLKRPVIRIAYDEDAAVYVNGVQALDLKKGNNTRHTNYPMPVKVAKTLKEKGNIITIHVKNRKESQYIDVGIGEESITW
ncbi:MAG: hypothetical protein HQL32_12570, partial [Planctomycetes bacterium]|nr:hypothetical protein [Planctomycetota bacterium]